MDPDNIPFNALIVGPTNSGHRGTNDYGRPISVVSLERNEVMKMYYAPSSLYWDLKNRSETNFIKYEGNQPSAKGYEYPVFKFAK